MILYIDIKYDNFAVNSDFCNNKKTKQKKNTMIRDADIPVTLLVCTFFFLNDQ